MRPPRAAAIHGDDEEGKFPDFVVLEEIGFLGEDAVGAAPEE